MKRVRQAAVILFVSYGVWMLGSMVYAGVRARAYADGYERGTETMRTRCFNAHAARLRAEIPAVERTEIVLAARKYLREGR
jgi:hypothetical protein